MSYSWGTAALPAATFDGQVQVDHLRDVWRWDAAPATWVRAPHLVLKRVASRFLLVSGKLAGSDIFDSGFRKRSGRMGDNWDTAYELAFIEVLNANGVLLGRIAHVDRAAFVTWLGTVVPTSGGQYDTDITVNVYEVFDTLQHLERMNAWNGLYGSFRGRDCYTSERGYGRSGYVPPLGGYSPQFRSYHTQIGSAIIGCKDLDTALINAWLAVTPGTAEPRFCWSTRNKKTLYRMPKQQGILMNVGSTDPGRYCWDTSSSTFVQAPLGWYEFHSGALSESNPILLRRQFNTTVVDILGVASGLRGQCGIFGQGADGAEHMVAYLMRNVNTPSLVAAIIKPYGVTQAAYGCPLNITTITHDIIAVGKHRGVPTDPKLYRPTDPTMVSSRGNEGFRLNNLSRLFGYLSIQPSGRPEDRGVDSPNLPDSIYCYMRNKTTGVRTEESLASLRLLHRKCGIPLALTFSPT